MNQASLSVYVGIDVSKAHLDVAVGQAGAFWSASNAAIGIGRTVERLQGLQPALIVIESTGGLEVPLMVELASAQLPFALVHPGRVRDFARSMGLLAKTNKLDARLLAQFGEAIRPPLTQLPGPEVQELNGLCGAKRAEYVRTSFDCQHLPSGFRKIGRILLRLPLRSLVPQNRPSGFRLAMTTQSGFVRNQVRT